MNTTLESTGEVGNPQKESLTMKLKSITFTVGMGLWTAFTLAGSVWGFIFLAGPNSVTHLDVIRSDNTFVNLIPMFAVFLCGGGLWGLGIARLMNADARSIVKAIMFTWSATFLIVLAFVSAGGFSRINVLPIFPHSRHYNFLLIFVPAVGIITAINSYVATGKLGFKEKRRSVGMYTGLAAALGFLIAGVVLPLGFGWEVGRPVIGNHGMLLILLICVISAALAGGMALGWALDKSRMKLDG